MLWSFRYYEANGRVGDIRKTHDSGSAKLRAQFKSKLVLLAQQEAVEWREPLCKRLSGECAGLIEIRFKVDGVQQRPLGYVSSNLEFTLLFWATEKSNRFVPKSACATAREWKANLESDKSLTNALWFALE